MGDYGLWVLTLLGAPDPVDHVCAGIRSLDITGINISPEACGIVEPCASICFQKRNGVIICTLELPEHLISPVLPLIRSENGVLYIQLFFVFEDISTLLQDIFQKGSILFTRLSGL